MEWPIANLKRDGFAELGEDMSTNDETARQQGHEDAASAGSAKQDDIHSVLRLIAAQIEDADRRQSQLVNQLGERLDQLESAAGLREPQAPAIAEEAPPLEESTPIQDAPDEAAPLAADADVMLADPAPQPAQDDFDAPLDAVFAALQASEEASSKASKEESPSEAFDADQLDLSADNFADLGTPDSGTTDATDLIAPIAAPELEQPLAMEFEKTDNAAPAAIEDIELAHEATLPETEVVAPAPAAEPQATDAPSPVTSSVSISGNADEPWNTDDAEKLMSVYDEDVFTPNEEVASNPAPVAEFEQVEPDEVTLNDPVATFDTHDDLSDAKFQAPEEPNEGVSAPPYNGHGETTAIERAWLEDRFAEIAVLIEQTMSQMRDNDPVHALKDRFEKIQDDLSGAVDELPTQKDFESLKSLEGEIEQLREHFENVQAQLSRLDTMESQLQSVVERLSDDNLQSMFQAQAPGSTDPAELAAIVGEYVANRVSDKQAEAPSNDTGVMRLEETLTRFIEEQRAGNASQVAVLDTLQDAMVQMLDRVDGMPEAPYAAAPAAAPAQPEAFHSAAHPEHLPHENTDEDSYADSHTVEPYGSFEDDHSNQHAQPDEPVSDDFDEELDRAATNASATQAAELAAQRHASFEPFSNDVGVSDGSDGSVPKLIVDPTQPQPAFEKTVGMKMPRAADAEPALSQTPQQSEAAQHAAPAHAQDPAAADPFADATASPVSRLRQEFIEEARRAKIQAEKDAEEAARLAAIEALEQGEQKGSGGITLFGYTIGGSKKSAVAQRVDAIVSDQAAAPASAPQYADASAEPQIFGMSRKKVMLAACGLMIAASGLLLLSPRGERAQQAPTMTGPVIERVMPENMSTGRDPQGAIAPAAAPQNGMELPEGVTEPQSQAPLAPPAAPVDGKFHSSDGNTPDIKGMGDRSDYYDPLAGRTSRLNAPGRPAVAYLDGVALQTPTRNATVQELAHADEQQSMAQWSLRLGDAASNRTTSDLLPEYGSNGTAPVHLAAHEVEKAQAPAATRAKGEKRSQLDLPPATVGPLSLRLAAAKGNPSAQFEVGARLAAGRGTQQDLKQAVTWYTRSASQGFAQSQYRLGTFFERGLGTKKDNARARIWYRRAAEQGNVKAMHNLAVLSAGVTSKKSDYATAATWFAKAASYGLADSQFNLAVLKENGLGVKKDRKAAYQFYTLASRAGDKDAKKRRTALAATMSADEISAADTLVKSWRSKRPSKLVNDPIAAGQAWKKSTSLGG